MKHKKIDGTLVSLRELHQDYFNEYFLAFSLRVQRLLHVTYISSELDYLHRQLEKQQCMHTKNLFFCVFDRKTDRLIGALEIRDQEETSNQLYSWLHENFWGEGDIKKPCL